MSEGTNELMQKMEAAAAEAAKEFKVTWTAQQVAEWMLRWKNTAGYKRLSKILIQAFNGSSGPG